jgi:phage terminase large subunit-like protein
MSLSRIQELECFHFKPRPDQPERNDMQTAFYESELSGIQYCLGGNGCAAAEQEIYDPILDVSRRIDSIPGPFHVWSIDEFTGNRVIALAEQPHACGTEDLCEFLLSGDSDGNVFCVTLDHRVFTEYGWMTMRDVVADGDVRLIQADGKVAYVEAHCFVRRDVYWDFHVPIYENYWMEGIYHHNSGTTTLGLAKMMRFINKTPPPRRDTPFWLISQSYSMVMNACWKEKLHQKGHIHPNDIDWPRIQWYKPNMDWPYSVPLKSWPNRPGKNWLLCFKSYEQGRASMQAESIGGFLFVEQFPWGILEEVMRGCREYSFTGNKLVEFTPVDPSLSMPLREMEEKGDIPADSAIFRCNTRCAMEAGHISEQWYHQFFGMVPDSMKPVREQGLWGNFEGAVYPEWNPNIHCTPEGWEPPSGLFHVRAIDFGFSIDHAFVCLFFCFDQRGRVWIYDEYYSNDASKTVIDHWKEIADMHWWPEGNPNYGVTWCDHDLDAVRTLGKVNEYTVSEEFPDGEYDAPSLQLAKKDNVEEGIEYVRYLLKPTFQLAPDLPVESRLKVVREKCPNLCRNFVNYHRHKQLTTNVNSPAVRADPVKIDDDAVDCMRYGLFSEASTRGLTPSTMAHQHSKGSVQIESNKFNQPKRRVRGGRDNIPGSRR